MTAVVTLAGVTREPTDPVVRAVYDGHWCVTHTGNCARCGSPWNLYGCPVIREARRTANRNRKGAYR